MQRKTEEKIRERELAELNKKIQNQREQLDIQNQKLNNSIKKLLELNINIKDISKALDIPISEIKNIAENM